MRIIQIHERYTLRFTYTMRNIMIRLITYLYHIAMVKSFSTCVAVEKVLHDAGHQSTKRVRQLYELLQQSLGIKDDSQYPRKRASLIECMRERFRSWVHFDNEGPNGELVFRRHKDALFF